MICVDIDGAFHYIVPHFFLGEIMKIQLDKLPLTGKDFDCQFGFNVDDTAFEVVGAKGHVKPQGELYFLEMRISATVADVCDRCLKKISDDFAGNVQLILSTEMEEVDPQEEIELSEDDMSQYFLPDGVLDVTDIVTQETIVMRPYKRLCKDDCVGICQGCGVDLNTENCACDEKTDNRWQALKKYMTNQNQEI